MNKFGEDVNLFNTVNEIDSSFDFCSLPLEEKSMQPGVGAGSMGGVSESTSIFSNTVVRVLFYIALAAVIVAVLLCVFVFKNKCAKRSMNEVSFEATPPVKIQPQGKKSGINEDLGFDIELLQALSRDLADLESHNNDADTQRNSNLTLKDNFERIESETEQLKNKLISLQAEIKSFDISIKEADANLSKLNRQKVSLNSELEKQTHDKKASVNKEKATLEVLREDLLQTTTKLLDICKEYNALDSLCGLDITCDTFLALRQSCLNFQQSIDEFRSSISDMKRPDDDICEVPKLSEETVNRLQTSITEMSNKLDDLYEKSKNFKKESFVQLAESVTQIYGWIFEAEGENEYASLVADTSKIDELREQINNKINAISSSINECKNLVEASAALGEVPKKEVSEKEVSEKITEIKILEAEIKKAANVSSELFIQREKMAEQIDDFVYTLVKHKAILDKNNSMERGLVEKIEKLQRFREQINKYFAATKHINDKFSLHVTLSVKIIEEDLGELSKSRETDPDVLGKQRIANIESILEKCENFKLQLAERSSLKFDQNLDQIDQTLNTVHSLLANLAKQFDSNILVSLAAKDAEMLKDRLASVNSEISVLNSSYKLIEELLSDAKTYSQIKEDIDHIKSEVCSDSVLNQKFSERLNAFNDFFSTRDKNIERFKTSNIEIPRALETLKAWQAKLEYFRTCIVEPSQTAAWQTSKFGRCAVQFCGLSQNQTYQVNNTSTKNAPVGNQLPSSNIVKQFQNKPVGQIGKLASSAIDNTKLYTDLPAKFLEKFLIRNNKSQSGFPVMNAGVGKLGSVKSYMDRWGDKTFSLEQWKALGWQSKEAYEDWLKLPVTVAFVGCAHFCVVPRVFDFDKKINGKDSFKEIPMAQLGQKTTAIFSIAAFELRGVVIDQASYNKAKELTADGTFKKYSQLAMRQILVAANDNAMTDVVLIPFGMGVFLGDLDKAFTANKEFERSDPIVNDMLDGWVEELKNCMAEEGPPLVLHCCLMPGQFEYIEKQLKTVTCKPGSSQRSVTLVNQFGRDAYTVANALNDTGKKSMLISAGDHDWLVLLDKTRTPGQCWQGHPLGYCTSDEYFALMTPLAFCSVQNLIQNKKLTSSIKHVNDKKKIQDDSAVSTDTNSSLREHPAQINPFVKNSGDVSSRVAFK